MWNATRSRSARILMSPDDPGGAPAPAAAPAVAQAPAVPAVPAPAAAPATNVAPAMAPAAPAANAAPADVPADPAADPDWFKKRAEKIARNAQADVLKSLGVTNLDEAKAKIDAAKVAEDAKKTDLEKAAGKINELTPKAQRAEHLEAVIKDRASAEMGSLTEAQRATVEELAGTDPAAQLQTIDRLKKGGLLAAPAPVAPAAPAPTAAPTQPKPVAAPASTTGAGSAPTPASPTNVDHRAVYESLQKNNPFAAAQYAERYGRAIYPDK